MNKLLISLILLCVVSCAKSPEPPENAANIRGVPNTPPAVSDVAAVTDGTLLTARADFVTTLAEQVRDIEPFEVPRADLFTLVEYDTSVGKMGAWLSKPVDSTKKHAAMIWITGGFPASGIDSSAWEPQDAENDQSAKVYRERGMIMMYPALRGCCNNPGFQEGFYGEVDDIIAAGKYVQQLDHVDPDMIFLGGHSTGGTLVLLVAAATDLFRGVISFGAVEDPFYYGSETICYAGTDARERTLRAPINFLQFIRTPTFVIEGTAGNIQSLRALRSSVGGRNPNLHFMEVPGLDHFAVLSPVNRTIAEKIVSLRPGDVLSLTTSDIDHSSE